MDIEPDIRAVIEPELLPGEILLWADKPHKFPISFQSLYALLFAVLWTGLLLGLFLPAGLVAVMAEPTVQNNASDTSHPAFGAVFLTLMCVFLMVGIAGIVFGLIAVMGPSREIYAITSKRGIIVGTFWRRLVTVMGPDTMLTYEKQTQQGLTTLRFGTATHSRNQNSGAFGFPKPTTFHHIKSDIVIEELLYTMFSTKRLTP